MKHLIIPDPHAHPDYDNERFSALGRFILKEKPEVIICIGDFGDMPSLSSYDKGTKGFEGRRYKKDILAVHDALEKLHKPINQYNSRRAKNKKQQYKPRWVMCLGNHEDRISRAVNMSAELEGTIGVEDLKFEEYGWEVHPFLEIVIIDGIAYSHYFVSGVASRPISGENIGKTLINKNMMSSVQGHSHIFDHAERTRADGTKLFGMSCGCFSHPEQIEGWNKATHHMWWMGIVILNEVDGEGYYDDLQSITTRKLMRDYG
jgi:hypothetical protein